MFLFISQAKTPAKQELPVLSMFSTREPAKVDDDNYVNDDDDDDIWVPSDSVCYISIAL